MTEGATPAGTARRAAEIGEEQHLPPSAFRRLGKTELTTAALGFGGYRVEAGDEGHRAALKQALRRGVNLIDTSSNYSDGGSETLIGRVLAEDSADCGATREALIVVSKVGYVQGGNMALAREAIAAGEPFEEMVEYQPSCWHCIHPRFLADQLQRSLERLGAEALDVYLLHNPEYFFSDWKQRHPDGDLAEAREEFYRRTGAAFRFFEQCIQDGRIHWYGVSSNTFGHPGHAPDFVSLERLIAESGAAAAAVRGAGAASGFAVVQCPLNLYEGGPALIANQERSGQTFLQLASEADLGVLVNRPLNAIRSGALIRLADVPVARPNVEQEIGLALDGLATAEQAFAALFRPRIASALPGDAGPRAPFEWSQALRGAYGRLAGREGWNQVLQGQVYPQLQQAGRFVMETLGPGPARKDFSEWFPDYCRKLEQVAGLVTEWLGMEDHARAQENHLRLAPLLQARAKGLPLSQKALSALFATKGVSCVLNGARRASYVEDSTAAMAGGPWPEGLGETILRAFAEDG